MATKVSEGKAKKRTRTATLAKFDFVIAVSAGELLSVKGEQFLAVALVYDRMRDYPWDVKNRFRSYLARGKYRTITRYGLPWISSTNPLVDEAVTVVPRAEVK